MRRPERVAGPRRIETLTRKWLELVASDVSYIGNGEGPRDFLVRFNGEEVAVKVTRMLDAEGWLRTRRVAFERELKDVVQSVRNEPRAPRWHVRCNYDPREPRPPSKKGNWVRVVRDKLRKSSVRGEIQLAPEAL